MSRPAKLDTGWRLFLRTIVARAYPRIIGQQRRLAIALAFLPPDVFNLYATRELTKCPPQEVTARQMDKARDKLLTLFARIDNGEFSVRQVAPRSIGAERFTKGDL